MKFVVVLLKDTGGKNNIFIQEMIIYVLCFTVLLKKSSVEREVLGSGSPFS